MHAGVSGCPAGSASHTVRENDRWMTKQSGAVPVQPTRPSAPTVSALWLHISPISPWLGEASSYQASGALWLVASVTSTSVTASAISWEAEAQVFSKTVPLPHPV